MPSSSQRLDKHALGQDGDNHDQRGSLASAALPSPTSQQAGSSSSSSSSAGPTSPSGSSAFVFPVRSILSNLDPKKAVARQVPRYPSNTSTATTHHQPSQPPTPSEEEKQPDHIHDYIDEELAERHSSGSGSEATSDTRGPSIHGILDQGKSISDMLEGKTYDLSEIRKSLPWNQQGAAAASGSARSSSPSSTTPPHHEGSQSSGGEAASQDARSNRGSLSPRSREKSNAFFDSMDTTDKKLPGANLTQHFTSESPPATRSAAGHSPIVSPFSDDSDAGKQGQCPSAAPSVASGKTVTNHKHKTGHHHHEKHANEDRPTDSSSSSNPNSGSSQGTVRAKVDEDRSKSQPQQQQQQQQQASNYTHRIREGEQINLAGPSQGKRVRPPKSSTPTNDSKNDSKQKDDGKTKESSRVVQPRPIPLNDNILQVNGLADGPGGRPPLQTFDSNDRNSENSVGSDQKSEPQAAQHEQKAMVRRTSEAQSRNSSASEAPSQAQSLSNMAGITLLGQVEDGESSYGTRTSSLRGSKDALHRAMRGTKKQNDAQANSMMENRSNVQRFVDRQAATTNMSDPNTNGGNTPEPGSALSTDNDDGDGTEEDGQTDSDCLTGTDESRVTSATGSRTAASIEPAPVMTVRFEHQATPEGHQVVTGREGTLEKCEDEVCPLFLSGLSMEMLTLMRVVRSLLLHPEPSNHLACCLSWRKITIQGSCLFVRSQR